jgi:hypothetical protein
MSLLNIFTKSEEIVFPKKLMTDPAGFDFFANLLITTTSSKEYIFNFKNVEWFEANLCAVLSSIIITNKTLGATFKCIEINYDYLKKTFENNGFLELVNSIKRPATNNSGIPLMSFDMKNENEVEQYIYKYVLQSENVPKMSEGAKRKVYRSIFEIYQNSVMHSGADRIFVCGQYYMNKGRIALTMVEIGKTFKENVNEYENKYSNYSGAKSIEWAVKSGNTTKKKQETGGLGLDLIREFLRLNQGKLQIKSAEGYWEEKKGVIFASDSKHAFSGSIVNIEFNLRDTNSYYIAEEIDIKDIL